jgi:hypothetical protein
VSKYLTGQELTAGFTPPIRWAGFAVKLLPGGFERKRFGRFLKNLTHADLGWLFCNAGP